jgi:hypothetical protein
MWFLKNPKDGTYLVRVKDSKPQTVDTKTLAKSFDTEDFAEGYATALDESTGQYFDVVNGEDEG